MIDSLPKRISSTLISLALVAVVSVTGFAETGHAAPSDFDHAKLARTARTQFIVPAYQRFATALQRLERNLAGLCDEPGTNALANVRLRYREAIAEWGRAEVIRFGPVVERNRFERIFYWPDRKGIGRRQVARILRTEDQQVLAASTLKNKSVAVQGLTALELLLHGPAAGTLAPAAPRGFRCRYALAIVVNLKAITAAVLDGWSAGGDFVKIWSQPGPGNRAYLSARETTLELVKVLDHGLQNIRDRRIAPILGYGANRKRKARPILWRSRLSMVLIHANIRSIGDLFVSAGLSDAYIASKPYDDERAASTARCAAKWRPPTIMRASQ